MVVFLLLIVAAMAIAAPVRYEQNSSQIVYTGTWVVLKKAFHSAGSYAYTTTTGSKISTRFHGTAIDYITNKDCVYGIAKVTLDGGTPTYVDLYSSITNVAQSKVYSATGLADADHVLTIEYTGTKNARSNGYYIGLDAFDIDGVLLQAAAYITPSAGAHGAITPGTTQAVDVGTDKTFAIVPATGYHIVDVLRDGVSIGASSAVTFTNVLVDHTLSATFAIDTFTITPTAGAHGTVTPGTAQALNYGASQTFAVAADPGYHLVDVTRDNVSIGASASVTFTNVTANHTLAAVFATDPSVRYEQTDYRIVYSGAWVTLRKAFHSAGSYAYTVSPGGKATILFRGTEISYITNKDCVYGIAKVTLDGGSPTYVDLFSPTSNVAQSKVYSTTGLSDTEHVLTIEYTGTKNPRSGGTYVGLDAVDVEGELLSPWLTVSPLAGAGGTISPSVAGDVLAGTASAVYTFTPSQGFRVADVQVDGTSIGAVGSYQFPCVTTAHTLTVQFEPDLFAITPSAGAHGSISPDSVQSVLRGTDAEFSFTPATNYYVSDVLVDGVSVGARSSYNFTDVAANHTIAAEFAINVFTVTSEAGAHGSVSPEGAQSVTYGADSPTFQFAPDTGYHVADVTVDGTSVGAASSWQLTNVTTDHVVVATFAIDSYNVHASAGTHGSISSAGDNSVEYGSGKSFTITPDANYHVADVLVDDVSVGAVTSYDFTAVAAAHTIRATFAIDTHGVTASPGPHGSITPSGTTQVAHGSSQTYQIVPNTYYHVADVKVDNVSVGAVTSYTLTNVTAAHTVSASFETTQYPITSSAGPNGAISPSTVQYVDHGSNQTYTFTPDPGYFLADVVLDGTSWGYTPSYTFTNVKAPHTIAAVFGYLGSRYEQTDSRIKFEGTWFKLSRTFHSAGNYSYTNTAGSKVTVKFQGTNISYITNKDNVYGIAKVTLDGGTPVYVDLFDSTHNFAQAKAWNSGELTLGEHTMVVEYTGTKNVRSGNYYIGLDAVDIVGTLMDANQ
jgi:hypothetical protein